MSFTINSEKVLKTMEKVLEISKVVNYDVNMVEHSMYVLFRHIKIGYNTYSSNSNDFYALKSFLNFKKINNDISKTYAFENFIIDFIENSDSIKNVDDFLSFLQQYFIFFHKTQKKEMNEFVSEYLSFAALIDGKIDLKQTPFINNEDKIKEIKCESLKYLNNKQFDFFDVAFHKNGQERGVIVNFNYVENENGLADDFINSTTSVGLRLHDFKINCSKAINKQKWNPKRVERTHAPGINSDCEYLLILDDELFPRKHGKNSKNIRINNFHTDHRKVHKLVCREFYPNDSDIYKNTLLVPLQLHFSFEEYFYFIIEQIKNSSLNVY